MVTGYALSDQVRHRFEYFGGLVFHRDSWAIHKVNQTGYAILQILAGQTLSRERLCQFLGAIYGELDEIQRRAVGMFLDQLLALGVIVEKLEIEDLEVPPDLVSCARIAEQSGAKILTRYLSAPTFVWWDITTACNLKCKQCYSKSGAPLLDELTTDEVRDILNQLAQMKVFYVYFLGGEPFLRKDFMCILQHCCSLGLEVMINSNGWYITQQVAHNLVQLGVRHVRVSIDGATPVTHDAIRGVKGSFDRAVEAVKRLKQAGIPVVGISPTVMQENIHEIESLIQLAHDLEANEIQLVQVCAVGRAKPKSSLDAPEVLLLKDLIARKSEEFGANFSITGSEGVWDKPFSRCVMEGKIVPDIMGCGAGRTCLAIAPNGHTRACLLFQYMIGDLRRQNLKEMWIGIDNPELQWLRNTKEGCEGCRYFAICSGPCPMQQIISPEQRACFVKLQQSKGEYIYDDIYSTIHPSISTD